MPKVFVTSASGLVVGLHHKILPKCEAVSLNHLKQYHWVDFACSLVSLSASLIQALSILRDSLKATTSLSLFHLLTKCYVLLLHIYSSVGCLFHTCVDSSNNKETREHFPLVVSTNCLREAMAVHLSSLG